MNDERLKTPCIPLPMFKCNDLGERVFCPACAKAWFAIAVIVVMLVLYKSGKLTVPSIGGN